MTDIDSIAPRKAEAELAFGGTLRSLIVPIAVVVILAVVIGWTAYILLSEMPPMVAGDWEIEIVGEQELRFTPTLPDCVQYGQFCVTPNPVLLDRARGAPPSP